MDRGTWRATVNGVVKSWTRLSARTAPAGAGDPGSGVQVGLYDYLNCWELAVGLLVIKEWPQILVLFKKQLSKMVINCKCHSILKELKLRQAVQGPLRRRWTFSLMLSLNLVQQCLLRESLYELMITQHNLLLMEMLFLGSVLIIIMVTNLAWEPVSQDLYPWLCIISISRPETLLGTSSSWLMLCQSYLRMYTLGKGLVELLQPWGILLICLQQPIEKYIMPCLTSEGGCSPAPFWCLCQKLFLLLSL